MSHYSVAVFTTDDGQPVDDLLAPYDESNKVETYVSQTKAELIRYERKRMQQMFERDYPKWRKNPIKYEAKCTNPLHIRALKALPDRMKWSDERLYQDAIKDYDEDELNSDGDVLSTYNPKSKWDWYVVGGRWKDALILKDGSKSNSALASEIDFKAMRKHAAAKLRPYEEAMKNSYMKEEHMRKRFRNEDEYIKLESTFSTYAVVTPDGEWHATGNMGWWCMSSETPDEERQWVLSYYERFIKPAIEKGWRITIVDCHI